MSRRLPTRFPKVKTPEELARWVNKHDTGLILQAALRSGRYATGAAFIRARVGEPRLLRFKAAAKKAGKGLSVALREAMDDFSAKHGG